MQTEADHLRDQHRQRLSQHRGLRLDPAHAPAEHAQAVDHRRVRIGADQRVRVRLGGAGLRFVREHDARQVFQVHLVDDAGVGRHDREVAERRLAPAQKRVALLVPRKFDLRVQRQRLRLAEFVDLHRVIDHQLGRQERVDARRVAAELLHRRPHRGQIDHRGHSGEVLKQHPGGHEGDLVRGGALRVPAGERADVRFLDLLAVLVAQQVLEQDAQRKRQPPRRQAGLLQRGESVDLELPFPDVEGGPTAEAVRHGRILSVRRRDVEGVAVT